MTTTQKKWTPGPWFPCKSPAMLDCILSEGESVGRVVASEVFKEADRALIAAAPDLYDALEAMLFPYELYSDGEIDALAKSTTGRGEIERHTAVRIRDARAALAKARGEK